MMSINSANNGFDDTPIRRVQGPVFERSMPELLQFDEFEVTEQVYESPHSLIFKTRQAADAPLVLLKVLKTDSPSPKEIVRFHQEYLIARKIDSPYVVKILGLIDQDNLVALRIEDIGAQNLNTWLEQDPPSILEGLEIAISVCRGLHDIHKQSIAHKDISSSNVVWNRQTRQVQIIDFGISSVLDKDLVPPEAPQWLEGNLAYMSPEQTGRMNRPVDFRTDFYSLGITLFELFARQRPFLSADPLELIHSHIAKSPPAPSSVNPAIPPMLDKIILKLLEKNAENRYQSAGGIERDLGEVLRQFRSTSAVEDFVLAQHDHSDRFLIPSKLYGRNADVAKLTSAFERVCNGQMDMSLVSGYSGVGKSSLVQELYRPLAAARGRYITGKFDQYQRDVPYSALAYAFNSFCDQILAESTEALLAWKQRILRAVGNNGQVLIEVVPNIENLVGRQPSIPAVDPQAAKNRFNQVLLSFMSEICGPGEPLVLFLDDLQWIDQASLELLKLMLQQTQIVGLHLVGAYRDNEVEASHPLTLMLNALSSAGQSYDVVHLSNLTPHNISDLVSDTLALPKSEIRDLVEVICRKTQGNAFFATEFFKSLHAGQLLKFSGDRWCWDTQKIEEENITENVVEFMASKLRAFSDQTQHALKLAACVGNEFDLRTLSIIPGTESTMADILAALEPAISSGVIRSRNDEYKKVGIVEVSGESIMFKFQHDRVQQAAYSLIPAGERPRIHFQIGHLLDEDAKASGNLGKRLFEIVSHLIQALPIIADPNKRLSIAQLNHQAGAKAMDAAAYHASTEYFSQAKLLLSADAFDTHHAFALQVHLDLAKSHYINGEFDRSEEIYPVLLEHVKSPMDSVRVRMVQMDDYHLQGDYERAIHVQKKGLALLGEAFPGDDQALETSIVEELALTPQYLGDRTTDDLLKAAEFESEETFSKMRILVGMLMSAYLVSKDSIVQWCSIKMTNVCLRFGNSELAAFAYVQYGYICVVRLKKFEEGWKFGDLAIRLSDRYDNVEIRGKVYFNFALFVNHWTRPISTSTDLFRKAYMFSVEGGDWTYAVYGAANIISNLLIEGRPCEEVASEGEKYFEFLRSKAVVGLNSFFLPGGYVALLNLQGKTERSDTFNCEHLNEETHLNGLGKLPIVEAWFYSAKIRSLFLYRHLDQAKAVFHKPDIVAEGVPSQIKVPEAYFYSCLTIAATYNDERDSEKQRRMLEFFDRYSSDIQLWSEHCPDNCLHKHLLIRAEESRFKQRDMKDTLALYDAAIESASKYRYANNVAVAFELKARYWLELGQVPYALIHLKEAHQQYKNWGVSGKVSQLEAEFPQLMLREHLASGSSASQTGTTSLYQLDLESIYKSAQVISSKVALNDLIESMLSIVMENVGANRSLLLLNEGSDLIVAANASLDPTTGKTVVRSGGHRVLGSDAGLPATVLNYVMNSRQPLIVDSHNLSEPFTTDPYFHSGEDLSIICVPIISHDQLTAMLFLENNLSSGVFSKERARILDILMAQISISLENSRLYEDLDRRVEQRTAELAHANEALKQSNAELEQFAYIASHDLQEPLRKVQSFGDLLVTNAGNKLDETGRLYLDRMQDGARRMQRLINDLLSFARVASKAKVFVEVDLAPLAREVVSDLESRLTTTGGQVEIGDLPQLQCDPTQMRQLLQNLIGNALKFHRDGVPPVVVVRSQLIKSDTGDLREPGPPAWAEITVADNGIGFEEKYLDRIFAPFQRLHGHGKYEGTGIGLAVCHKVVERHGGAITATSTPGRGTTFIITLPLRQPKGVQSHA